MRAKERFPGHKKLACHLAVLSACAIWLCCAHRTQAQQWTTSTNSASNINSTNSGNVGVGTSVPQAKLDVEGSSPYNVSGVFSALYAKGTADYPMALMLDGAGTNDNVARLRALNNGQTKWQLNFGDDITYYSWFNSTFNQRFSVTAAGNAVFGASSPVFDANAAKFLLFDAGSGAFDGEVGVGSNQSVVGSTVGQYAFVNSNLGGAEKRVATIGAATDGAANGGSIEFYTWNAGVVAERMRINRSGNVGIGKSNPAVALDVVGDIAATGNISAKYQDVAEWVPSSQKLSAGTVVVLDTTRTNHVLASTKAYDTGVAGVISDTPGVILGQDGADKVKVATTGRVRVKVDATRAPIHVGDLLVTSGVEGVAMKSVPVDLGGVQIHRPGTIIGKALEPLEKGTGEILVLLSLQ